MDFLTIAKSKQEAYIKDLNTLVEIESVLDTTTKSDYAPFGLNTRKALDAFLDIAKRDGFDTKDIDGYAGVIEYGKGEETFGILGHLDIVPLGDGWTKDPLKVTYNDGYIFGRGVMDDKGPTMAAYYALKIIRELNIPLKKRVMLIAGCAEETSMSCMNYYKEHAEIPQMGFVPDADFPVIYGEKGGLHLELQSKCNTVLKKMIAGMAPNIVIEKADAYVDAINEKQKAEFAYYCKANGLQGSIFYEDSMVRVHMEGKAAHAAMPYLGKNAALHLFNFIGCSYDDAYCKELYEILHDWMGIPVGIHVEGTYMSCLTMNVGLVHIENGNQSITLDIRYPNDTDGNTIYETFNKHLSSLASKMDILCKKDSKPLFVNPDSTLVHSLMNVYQKYTKDMVSQPKTIGGGTYARKFENFVSFGPERPMEKLKTDQYVGGCHQKDEGILLDHLIEAIAIYADAIVTLCSEYENA
ncbi:MAG: dipeptidase PepV [Holdemanella sp.]|nr:dipeptidase PepV [Holdemanella sp.]